MTPADDTDSDGGRAAFASERLFEADDPGIGVATFEPDDAGRRAGDRELSGWMFLAGDESAEDVDDPERIRLPDLSVLVEQHPELQSLLDDHDGSAGSWLHDEQGWSRA